MNIGEENEYVEFKKSTSELKEAMDDISAILNKHGRGTIYFGVKPNGDVVGQEIGALTLDDVARFCKDAIEPKIYPEIKEVVLGGLSCIKVDFKGNERPYSSYGRYFLRVDQRSEEMTPDSLKSMMASTDYTSRWENTITNYGIEVIDHNALLKFYNKATSSGRLEKMDKYDEKELLSGLGLFEDDKLNNAGYYLFSSTKSVVLKMATYVTDERVEFSDIKRINDNIYNLIDIALIYIKEKIRWKVISGNDASRIEIPEIPVDALREIVVNAFAHANYRGVTEHEIDITPTQVEIYNPGEFPINLTPDSFVNERRKSQPRNKTILDVLYKSKEVEMFGSGFKKVYKLCKENNTSFTYDITADGFSFVFSRANKNVPVNVPVNDHVKLTGTDYKVLQVLMDNPNYTRGEIASILKLHTKTVQRAVKKLTISGKIIRRESDKSGYWEIIEK